MKFDDELCLREARNHFFDESGFSEDQYSDRFVRLKFGPIPFLFPNTSARQRAVKVHDLHHVLTEYGTNWKGESEISAWELGSGCKDYIAAWVLNGLGLMMGMVIAPQRVVTAFLRGRRTGNLYGRELSEDLLDEPIGVLRTSLRLSA